MNEEIYCNHEPKDSLLLRCQFSSNWSIGSMQFPTKIPASFLTEIDQLTLKFLWKCKGPRMEKKKKLLKRRI